MKENKTKILAFLTCGLFIVFIMLTVGKVLFSDKTKDTQDIVETSEKSDQVLKKEIRLLEDQNAALHEQLGEGNSKRIEKEKEEETVLAQQNLFVRAAFTFDNVKERNKHMLEYMYSNERAEKLQLHQEVSGESELVSVLLENKNYIREIDENNYEVITRVYTQYNHSVNSEQRILFYTHFRKNSSNEWKVFDMKFAEDSFAMNEK
jgi:hypothetical protein